MNPPIRVCRGCGYPPARCSCAAGVDADAAVLVPDAAAHAIRHYLRAHPELRKEEYIRPGDDPLHALCYPAAESYYHVRNCTLDVYCLSWSDVDQSLSGTHWYLREPDDGRFIDLGLAADFPCGTPPFEQGRRRAFLTGDTPSKRTQQVLAGIGVL